MDVVIKGKESTYINYEVSTEINAHYKRVKENIKAKVDFFIMECECSGVIKEKKKKLTLKI